MDTTSISISGPAIAEPQQLSITIEIEANVRVSAREAQRNVTAWLLDNVGHLAMADPPRLMLGTRTAWRVPVMLSSPHHPPIGPIGVIDVDVQTGEVLASPETAEKLISDGRAFSRSVSSAGD